MRQIFGAVVFVLALVVAGSVFIQACTQEHSIKVDDSNSNSRIKLKESRQIDGYTYKIISVDDSTEFLVLPGHAAVKIK